MLGALAGIPDAGPNLGIAGDVVLGPGGGKVGGPILGSSPPLGTGFGGAPPNLGGALKADAPLGALKAGAPLGALKAGAPLGALKAGAPLGALKAGAPLEAEGIAGGPNLAAPKGIPGLEASLTAGKPAEGPGGNPAFAGSGLDAGIPNAPYLGGAAGIFAGSAFPPCAGSPNLGGEL